MQTRVNDEIDACTHTFDRRRFLAWIGTSIWLPALASAEAGKSLVGTQASSGPKFELDTEYLFTRRTKVRREVIGPVAEGFRVNIYSEGGRLQGPRISGISGAGADSFTIRRDGMGVIDSRVMIHAEPGALIYSYYSGVTDLGADAYERVIRGELPEPGKIFIAVRFQTAHPEFTWMNRLQAIGLGTNENDTNIWDTYALR